MSSAPVQVVGLQEALGRARLSNAEQDALAAQLRVLARSLQQIDLLLQGIRVRGDLPANDEDIVVPDIVPNTLLPYLRIESIKTVESPPEPGAAGGKTS